MFRTQDLQDRLRETPFVPFDLIVTTGRAYPIDHPELVLVGQRDLVIGLPSKDVPGSYEALSRVALLHVVELRDRPASAASGNGPA